MSVEVIVRAAREADTEQCEAIDFSARQGLSDQRGGEAWLAEHEPLSHVGDWLTHSFVAEIDTVIVGFLVGGVVDTSRGRVFRVDRVYVVADARELGCGDDLLAAAMSRAGETGCAFLEAVALPGDRDTKNLYERAGVTARSITVSKRLSGPSSSADASR
jgi:GNAT superfamily N-acetyltransferase